MPLWPSHLARVHHAAAAFPANHSHIPPPVATPLPCTMPSPEATNAWFARFTPRLGLLLDALTHATCRIARSRQSRRHAQGATVRALTSTQWHVTTTCTSHSHHATRRSKTTPIMIAGRNVSMVCLLLHHPPFSFTCPFYLHLHSFLHHLLFIVPSGPSSHR